MVHIIIPLGICVVMPVLIVWIFFRAQMNSDNKRAAVLIEAIKANNNIDAKALSKAFSKKSKSPLEVLQSRLLKGCIFSLIGLVLIICAICLCLVADVDSDSDLFVFAMLVGPISAAIGASFLIVYFVTRKQLPIDKTDEEG